MTTRSCLELANFRRKITKLARYCSEPPSTQPVPSQPRYQHSLLAGSQVTIARLQILGISASGSWCYGGMVGSAAVGAPVCRQLTCHCQRPLSDCRKLADSCRSLAVWQSPLRRKQRHASCHTPLGPTVTHHRPWSLVVSEQQCEYSTVEYSTAL